MNKLYEPWNKYEWETIHAFIDRLESTISEIESFHDNSTNSNQWEHEDIFLKQYTTCVGFLSDFFRFVPNQSWQSDNIGNCNISTDLSEDWISGPFQRKIFQLRNELSPNSIHACAFHRENIGCVLRGLKSPRCVANDDWNTPRSYDENNFRNWLRIIQLWWWNMDKFYSDTSPQKNWIVVLEFLNKLKIVTLDLQSSLS